MFKTIDSVYSQPILKIITKTYPFIKTLLEQTDKMTINEYLDVIVVVDCDDFCKFYGIDIKDEPFDTGFINYPTNNFHFVLDVIYSIHHGKLQKKLDKDGVDIKEKIKDLTEMLLMTDKEYTEKFKPHELNFSTVKFYFDCDNKY